MAQYVGLAARVIGLHSIKRIDVNTLRIAASTTEAVLTLEDCFAEGWIGEAVAVALSDQTIPVHSLAVRKRPNSGKTRNCLSTNPSRTQQLSGRWGRSWRTALQLEIV